jgi:ACR3 family arsenite transporter
LRREDLERWQVFVYAVAIGAGAALGLGAPELGALLTRGLWPLLAVLLFATFLQVPLTDLHGAIRNRRYLGALLAGNFIAVPLVVWGLSQLLPDSPALRLGFFLVMLVPCTDWFTTFSHLGRGDGRLALASTPVLLLVQMGLLPVFLWLFLGPEATAGMRAGPFLQAFAGIIVLPLAMAFGVERAARHRPRVAALVQRSAWLPVPLLGLVLLVITAGEIDGMLGALAGLTTVGTMFVAYLVIAPVVALGLSRMFGLTGSSSRTLVFSLGTRNSFVVLPLVLAWPGAGPAAATVVVLQSLVELCGMLAYLAVVPRLGGGDSAGPGSLPSDSIDPGAPGVA